MARPVLLAICVSVALAVLAAPVSAQAASPARAMTNEINKVRARNGLPALRHSRSLDRSANRYSHFLMRRNFLGHMSRIRASSRFSRLGETLALHRGWRARVRSTVRRWMHSPSHRRALLSPGFRWAGAGKARGRFGRMRATIWTVQLGR